MNPESSRVCTIIEHLSDVDLWSIGIEEVLNALVQGLQSRTYALLKRSSQNQVIKVSNGVSNKKLKSLLCTKKHINFPINVGDDTFHMHFFDIPQRNIPREEYRAVQVVLKMLSKALQMRQVSKERIIETQIINRLNLNVTTALDEKKIVENLETAARKMLGMEQIYLFYKFLLFQDSHHLVEILFLD